jgi:glutaredoxin
MTAPPIKPRRASLWSLAVVVLVVLGLSRLGSYWQERQQAELMRAQIAPGELLMLSSETCEFCRRARVWLDAQRVPYSECFIETDPACAAQYQAYRAPGTPTFLLNGQRVVGFDRQRLVQMLEESSRPRSPMLKP